MTQILIVDDDAELSEMLADYLAAEDYNVERVFDGETGAARALQGNLDAVILDVMMPGIDGFETLRRIRTSSEIPVLMLTAKGDDIDRIVGLEIGADDYLSKPFNPRELLARLRAVLRRSQSHPESKVQHDTSVHIGRLSLNASTRKVQVGNTELDLTSTEFNLLHSLSMQAGQVVSKETLSEQALGRPLEKYDRSIDMHMSNLRKKLQEHELGKILITVRGQGYQISPEVS